MSVTRIEVLGLGVDSLSLTLAVERVSELLCSARAHLVSGLNLDQLQLISRDPELYSVVERATLVLPDGMSVLLLARLDGSRFPERVPAIDLFEALLAGEAASERGVYLLGASAEVVDEAAESYRRRTPSLRIVGTHDGYFDLDEETDLIEAICAAAPAILALGISSPKKEQFFERNAHRLPPCIVIGVGGAFDIASGRIRRAPRIVQRVGLEWAWRMAQEPRRMAPRYLKGARFLTSQILARAAAKISFARD